MKIVLPENVSEITLGMFQRFMKLIERTDELSEDAFNKRKVEIFIGLPRRDIKNISQKDYQEILNQIDTAMETDVQFVPRFELNGVEYGFCPNLDDMTTGEWADLSKFGEDVENLHQVMAVLFRPVIKKDGFKNYKIASYTGDEDAELMKQTPLNIVNGALFFFGNLAKELRLNIQKSTMEVLLKADKHQTSSRSGDGTPAYTHSQTETY